MSDQKRADEIMDELEILARELCDTYYLTVDPHKDRMMVDAYDKISEQTRIHWRAQARLMRSHGWIKS